MASGGKCVTRTADGPQGACAQAGQACVPDWRTDGVHCCQAAGAPQLCVYGKCTPCVLHGEECKAFGTQVCCGAKDGDSCVLDPQTEKVVCDIPDAPDE